MSYKRKDGIVIHNDPSDYEKMRVAGKVAAECLDFITPHVQVGVTTGELDDLCREFMDGPNPNKAAAIGEVAGEILKLKGEEQ